MTDFASRLADQTRDDRCDRCRGAVVPVGVWMTMPPAMVRHWRAKVAAQRVQVDALQPGEPIPAPLLCRCRSDSLAEAIERLAGRDE